MVIVETNNIKISTHSELFLLNSLRPNNKHAKKVITSPYPTGVQKEGKEYQNYLMYV